MSEPVGDVFDHWDYPGPGWLGSAHSVSADGRERDAVDQLHDVVEEVTGTRPERPVRRIGFI